MKGARSCFSPATEILQSHDPKLVLLAAAICALGSFITLFLFAQAREMHGQGRGGWLFLAGFAAGAVMWTTHFVALLAFQPDISIGYDPALTGGAFFVAVLLSTDRPGGRRLRAGPFRPRRRRHRRPCRRRHALHCDGEPEDRRHDRLEPDR